MSEQKKGQPPQRQREPKPGRALTQKAPESKTNKKGNLISQLRSIRISHNRGSGK